MIAEPKRQVEPLLIRLEESICREQHLVAAGWQNLVELVRAADCVGLCLGDFSHRLSGVAVGYLRQCGEDNRKPSWSDAATYLARFGIANVDDLYFVLVDTPVSEDDPISDLVQQVQRAADQRADEDCRYVTRQATVLVLHALSCLHCQQCANAATDLRRPRGARLRKLQRRAAVYV